MSDRESPVDIEETANGGLAEIRSKLKEEYEKAADKTLYDEKAYERFLSDDDYVKRYIKRKKTDVAGTVAFLSDILRWRKKIGVPDMTEATFPREFFDLGGIHVYSTDKDGNTLCHVRLRLFQKIPEILDLLKKFTVFQMLKADEEGAAAGKGWVLVFDCTGAGVANADVEMASFVINTLKNYFPSGQRYVLVHNLPWLLNALKNLVFAMLPGNVKKRIQFSTDKCITEFIPKENLPIYMNGTCDLDYPSVPKAVVPTADMVSEGALPLSADEQKRVKKYYEKLYADLNKQQLVANVN